MAQHRPMASLRNPPDAPSSVQLRASSFQKLRGTANRVETPLTHREQTLAYRSTRHAPHPESVPFQSRAVAGRSPLQSPASNLKHPEPNRYTRRLETRVSDRKQRIAYHSNRYSSRHSFLAFFQSPVASLQSPGPLHLLAGLGYNRVAKWNARNAIVCWHVTMPLGIGISKHLGLIARQSLQFGRGSLHE
jgi:hypothetical protein